MPSARWLVLIADLRASRAIPARKRADVDRAFSAAADAVARNRPKSIRLRPQILKGDELQVVLTPDAPVLLFALELRARLRVLSKASADLRVGIGSGTIERLSSKGPFSSDGRAFHLARSAIERSEASGGGRRFAWLTGRESNDALVDPLLSLVDAVAARWTVPQWEAVVGRLEGLSLDEIARTHRVSFQSVSKRLIAASWKEVEAALLALQRLNAADSTPRR